MLMNLTALVDKYGIQPRSVLHIGAQAGQEIQGYELPALKGLGDHIGGFDAIYAAVNRSEVHEEGTGIQDLDQYLAGQGFTRALTQWAGVIRGTALYVRSVFAAGTARILQDGITAYPVGGMGNQLFIIVAAWAQAKRLGCPLYIDWSWYGLTPGATPRQPQCSKFLIPALDVGDASPWKGAWPVAGRVPGLQVWKEANTFAYDPTIETIGLGTTITGYCQAWRYVAPVAQQVAGMLMGAQIPAEERHRIEAIPGRKSISVHLRRGDYLNAAVASHHGMATTGYMIRGLNLALRLGDFKTANVFSDSPQAVEAELRQLGIDGLDFSYNGLSDVASLLAMAAGDAMIMSNSSFSWWAAFLMSMRNPAADIIAPRPWMQDGTSAADLLLPGWITLDAR